jgi:hypothetical protein
MPRETSKLRVDAIRARYLKIAARTFADFERDEAAYIAIQKKYPADSDIPPEEREPARLLASRVVDQAIQIIVFSAMVLEAAIYDYAATHLGDETAGQIDKLDVTTKYMLVPKLVTSESVLVGGIAYHALKTTVSARNKLVHWKSSSVDSTDVGAVEERLRNSREIVKKLLKEAHTAMEATIFMGFEFQRLMRSRNEQAALEAVKSGDPHDIEMESFRDRTSDGTMFPDLTLEGTLVAMDLPPSLRTYALKCKRRYESSVASRT